MSAPKPTTHAATLQAIRALGLSVRCADGEYRITGRGLSPARAEAVAYYTTNRDDAIATAREFVGLLAEGGRS